MDLTGTGLMGLAVAFVGLAVAGTLARVFTVSRLNSPDFPWGTLAVNVSGSLTLGLLGSASPEVVTLIGVSALGSFTTFSTFAHESVVMARERRGILAVAYTLVTVAAGVAAAALGLALTT